MSTAPATVPSTDAHPESPGLVRDVLSLFKPRLSLLVIITGGGGLVLADQALPWGHSLAAVGGTAGVVAGANALNNYLERDTDRWMARTKNRPLPAGRLDPRTALAIGAVLSLGSIAVLTAIRPLAALLASLALLLYVLVYTPLKRRTAWNTLVGAIPGAMPPLIGWTAATGSMDPGGLLLFAILFIWQLPHSYAIALYRRREYEQAGLVVLPSVVGDEATRRHVLGYSVLLLLVSAGLLPVGVSGLLSEVVALGLGGGGLWMAWQGLANLEDTGWPRRMFLYTLAHMSGLFLVLVLDLWV